MKKTPAFVALSLLAFPLTAVADTFTLKDGSTIEAKVLKEDSESYFLEVQVTKSIRDERTVPKADVVKVVRERPDLKAFEAIKGIVPTPDLTSEADYIAKISSVEKFLKAYPMSTSAKDAKVILETLKKEVNEIAAGGVKIDGKVVPKEDYLANAYDFDARVQEAKIRKLLADGQSLAALRLFSDFDRDYRTSLAYGSLLPLAKQMIQNHISESQEALASMEARKKERDIGLQRMSNEDRARTEGAIKEQDDAIDARYKSEREGAVKQLWVTTSPFHKSSLEEAVRFGQTELARISEVKTEIGVDGGKAYRELYSAVHSDANAATVSAAVTAAKTTQVPARYIEPLEAAAKGRK